MIFRLASALALSAFPALSQTCTIQVTPEKLFTEASPNTVAAKVTASAPNCPWFVSSEGAWIAANPPGGQGSGTLSLQIAPNGSGAERIAAVRIGAQTITVTQRISAQVFEDVAPAETYFEAVALLKAKSITAGCTAAPPKYCPADHITRGQLAIFMTRVVNGNDTFDAPAKPYYADVPATHIYFRWIQKAREFGLIGLNGGDKFEPDAKVTRAEIAALLVQARNPRKLPAGPKKVQFKDVARNHAAFVYVQLAHDAGIEGCGGNKFCPDDLVTRGDMALFIARTLEPAPR